MCRNPPRDLWAPNSALRSCALEADRANNRASARYVAYVADGKEDHSFAEAVEKLAKSFYIDRNLKTTYQSVSEPNR